MIIKRLYNQRLHSAQQLKYIKYEVRQKIMSNFA